MLMERYFISYSHDTIIFLYIEISIGNKNVAEDDFADRAHTWKSLKIKKCMLSILPVYQIREDLPKI